MKKTLVVAVVGLALGGGAYWLANRDSPFVAGCEEFVIDGLKAPSTYRRLEASERVEQTTLAEFKRLGSGWAKYGAEHGRTFWLHQVRLTSDAENSFGTPIRDTQYCTFDRIGTGDELSEPSKPLISMTVSSAKSDRDSRSMVKSGLLTNEDGRIDMDPAYTCCIM